MKTATTQNGGTVFFFANNLFGCGNPAAFRRFAVSKVTM